MAQAGSRCARVCLVPCLTCTGLAGVQPARMPALSRGQDMRGTSLWRCARRSCLIAPRQLGSPFCRRCSQSRPCCIMRAVRMSEVAVLARAGAEAGSANAASRVSRMRVSLL